MKFNYVTEQDRAATRDLRREFHQIPELAYKENETASRIANYLRQIGLEVVENIGQTGLIATLKGTQKGDRSIMVRADIDALPIEETSGRPFASSSGRMHACGHDGHIAIAIQTARVLARAKDKLRGEVQFLFQPAEEIGSGAQAMIDDGLFNKIKPDRMLGLHIWSEGELNKVYINEGPIFSAASMFRIVISGQGGHASTPHLLRDPVIAAAQVIMALQTITSREVEPDAMRVVTIGKLESDSAANIIPREVVLEGTTRAFSHEIMLQMKAAIERIAINTAKAFRMEATMEELSYVPPVVNDDQVARWARDIAREMLNDDQVASIKPLSYADDVSEFLNRVPGLYFVLGAGPDNAPHHNPKFDFNEDCLGTGVELFTRCVVDYLGS